MSSEKDQKVLDFMFDPYLVESSVEQNKLFEINQQETKTNEKELTDVQKQANKLEIDGVEFANKNQLDRSLDCFTQALKLWPHKASILNNRAQVYRLRNQIEEAKTDLNKAIDILNQNGVDSERLVARQAYCQRALIHLLQENQDQGLKDMAKSAELGNKFARDYMAKMNPYAALCNKMLEEMFAPFKNTCPKMN